MMVSWWIVVVLRCARAICANPRHSVTIYSFLVIHFNQISNLSYPRSINGTKCSHPKKVAVIVMKKSCLHNIIGIGHL